MLLSVSLILLAGTFAGFVSKKIHFPPLFGMILAGIVLGPCVLDLLDDSILSISIQLRKIALIVILLRAGLKLNIQDLKKNGRSALLMCFLPATLEILGMIIVAPQILGISTLDAAIMGAVVAAVSPAVVVPRMIKLIDEKRGTDKGIPQMILAGASVDDVFVIVMFATFTSLAKGEGISIWKIAGVPISIITGIGLGFAIGVLLSQFWKKIHVRDTSKVIFLICASLLMVVAEDRLPAMIPFASLIGVMTSGLAIKMKDDTVSARLSSKLDRLWVPSEIFLFVLVGASVEINSAASAGIKVIALLASVIVFRMAGVVLCMAGTKLSFKERLFCAIAYTPKATVQAAIGGLPLAMGFDCGTIVLTVSVLAILTTAPLGAFAMDLSYRKLLNKEESHGY
ncbi:MAG: cation:proton antiporter [Treponema sp.]|nr:cation:proton antiporter [Candidatus Treponema equi]